VTRKLSSCVREMRERETWLLPLLEEHPEPEREASRLLAVAALLRGVAESAPAPEQAEEQSRSLAVEFFHDQHVNRAASGPLQAPWYLRAGRVVRTVFTLGKRR
jgi:hypothetical protein